jgi:hypothetical protein
MTSTIPYMLRQLCTRICTLSGLSSAYVHCFLTRKTEEQDDTVTSIPCIVLISHDAPRLTFSPQTVLPPGGGRMTVAQPGR